MFVFVKLKSVVTDSEVLTKSNKIKELMEVKIDTTRLYLLSYLNIFSLCLLTENKMPERNSSLECPSSQLL